MADDAPTEHQTGFMLFAAEHREEVEEEAEDADDEEIGRLLQKRWEGLSEKEKKSYEGKASKTKVAGRPKRAAATKSRATSKASAAAEEKAGKRKRGRDKKEKDPNAPKRPTTAFFFFNNEFRAKAKAEDPSLGFKELGTLAGEKWRSMSAEEKAPFERKANADKERYKREQEAYQSKGAAAAADDDDDEADEE